MSESYAFEEAANCGRASSFRGVAMALLLTSLIVGCRPSEAPGGECVGIERVRDWMAKGHGDVQEDSERLIAELEQFRSSATQFDDMCLVCFSVG